MRSKPCQVNSIGEGITHLIINGDNTDNVKAKRLEEYLHYLDNFVAKLRVIVNDRKWGEYKW